MYDIIDQQFPKTWTKSQPGSGLSEERVGLSSPSIRCQYKYTISMMAQLLSHDLTLMYMVLCSSCNIMILCIDNDMMLWCEFMVPWKCSRFLLPSDSKNFACASSTRVLTFAPRLKQAKSICPSVLSCSSDFIFQTFSHATVVWNCCQRLHHLNACFGRMILVCDIAMYTKWYHMWHYAAQAQTIW